MIPLFLCSPHGVLLELLHGAVICHLAGCELLSHDVGDDAAQAAEGDKEKVCIPLMNAVKGETLVREECW